MLTPEQLKGKVRSFSERRGLSSQEVLQMYLFERVLQRLAVSKYSKNFILKGGLLISSMLGISERTTMDMDTTVTGIQMEEDEIERVIREILSIDVGDGIQFQYKKLEPIREDDAYNNFRAYFNAVYGKINNPMKIDITTGDKITPAAVHYSYHLILDDESVPVMAYSLETIIAEKYETIILRNIGNTRARDFYDLYRFFQLYKTEIRPAILKMAVVNTATKRGSLSDLEDWKDICDEIRGEPVLKQLWDNYQQHNTYAKEITFDNIVDAVVEVSELIGKS